MSVREAVEDAAIAGGLSYAGFWLGGAVGGPALAIAFSAVGGAIGSGLNAWRRGEGDGWEIAGAALVGAGVGLIGGVFGAVNSLRAVIGPNGAPMLTRLLGTENLPRLVRSAIIPAAATGLSQLTGGTPFPPDKPTALPTKDVSLATFPDALRPMEMPDQDLPPDLYPEKYRYAKTLQGYYEGTHHAPEGEGFPQTILAFWQSFGNPPQVDRVPATVGVPDAGDVLPDETAEFLVEYRQRARQLRAAVARFQQLDREVVELARTSGDISRLGQGAVREIVSGQSGINQKAPVVPPSDMSETRWIMGYVEDALKAGERTLRAATNQQGRVAGDVDSRAQRAERERDEARQQLAQFLRQQQDAHRQRSNNTNAAMDRGLTERHAGLREQDRNRLASSNPELQSLLSQLRRSNATAEQQARQLAQAPASAAQNAAASGPGMDQMMQQMMLRSLLGNSLGGNGFRDGLGNANRLDASRNDRLRDERDALRAERERLREDRLRAQQERNIGARPVPGALAPAASAAVNPPPPPRVADVAPPNSQPGKDGSPAQGGPPARTPGEDGKVLYTFEDGRQQRVWPVVAAALDVACADNAGTNAQTAYKDSPVNWDDDKEIGPRVDPNQVMTGDICAFEKTEAIAVVWGSPDSGGTLELVVNGKLVPFDPEAKEFEALGPFVGFMHPSIDQGGTGGAPAVVAADNQAVPVPAG